MKAFLLFLCSLFLTTVEVHAAEQSPDSLSRSHTTRYTVAIDMKRAALTGILVLRHDDEAIYGSIVNEFGVSAMDFIYDKAKDKVKFRHVVNFLDKWYIRRVLKLDLRYCLHVLYDIPYSRRHKYQTQYHATQVQISNVRRGIEYTFASLKYEATNDSER